MVARVKLIWQARLNVEDCWQFKHRVYLKVICVHYVVDCVLAVN